ncbi:ATP-dependent RecD-like DNA helicase [Candidatus Poribacteria bacterium]|nr:ATP-dependent RecD-like DNA helicase [Candidatus Poribacteria bacterium]
MPPPWKTPVTQAQALQPLRTETELTGTVGRIVFASEDGTFKVARFLVEGEKDNVTVSGNLAGVAQGEPLRVQGEWKMHRQHGPTFEAKSYVPILPAEPEMLKAYLGSGLVKGIGESYAGRIVEHFGPGTLDILEKAPDRLTEVKGLGRKRAEAIGQAWIEHRQMHDVMLFLARYDVSPALAKRLLRHYGPGAAAVLRTNPYQAGMEVHGIGFMTADRMARAAGMALDSPDRVRAGLLHTLVRASDEGHTYLPRERLLEHAVELLNVPAELVETVYEDEARSGRLLRVVPLPDGEAAVFMRSLYLTESSAARMIIALVNGARPLLGGEEAARRLAAFERQFRFDLAPQQREAVLSILHGGVSVVTGGPGTGKTTLVRALLHVLQDSGVSVSLCSPTGRAAQRLAETTHRFAATIHRLLKYTPQNHQFTYGAENPLKTDLLIVDESSMLDIPLAYHLLSALAAGTAVVFVGDVDQLPSVGPGCFLGDLISSGRIRTTRLEVVFRQASQSHIVVNAHRINHGQLPRGPQNQDESARSDFFFIEREEPAAVQAALLDMVSARIPRKFGLDPITDIQVLTPMRRGSLGTMELNRLLQERLNPGVRPHSVAGMALRTGDKVIQNQNNYELEVFNGDVGRVASMAPHSMTIRVMFGQRPVEYRFDEAEQLSLAYAATIHKSQGSEYPAVIVLLHTQHYVMLRRNLIYTAVTRGRKLVVVIGSRKALRIAVQNAGGGERLSALGHWLLRPPGEGDLFGR